MTKRRRREPIIIPAECLGKWIAWDAKGRKIVAVADDVAGVKAKATEAGHENHVVQHVPKGRCIPSVERRALTDPEQA